MKRVVLVVLALASGGTAAAQEPWRSSYFPYPIGNPTDGAMLMARWQRTRNAPYFLSKSTEEDIVNPVTFAGAFSVEGGLGTLGSRVVRAEFRGPALVDGWRFRGLLGAERTGRLGYYGAGGDIERVDGLSDRNANAYRVHRARYLFQADVTRRLAGNLRFALGAFLDRTEFRALPDSTLFRTEVGSSLARTNLILRPALVFDSRDREFTPAKGVLLEVGAGLGTGGESGPGKDSGGYAFGYANLRAYFSPRDGTVIALRGLVRDMEDRAPLSARLTVPGWEREFALSGAEGHRSFPMGSLAASSVRLAGLEVRHDLINAGDLGAVTLLGFADHARLNDESATFRNRTEQVGAGAGLALRVLRSAIVTFNFAGGSNGFNFSMGSGWTF